MKITDLEIAQESATPVNKENIIKYLSQLQGLACPNQGKKGWIITIKTNLDK